MPRSIPIRIVLASTLLAFALGCAKPPLEAIDAKKREAQAEVQNLEAHIFAPDAVRSVQEALAAVDAVVMEQESKLALFRKYDAVMPLLAAVDGRLGEMRAAVEAGRDRMRGEAEAALQQAASLADSVESEYRTAPSGKGARTALGTIRTQLTEVRDAMAQAESELGAGSVGSAHTRSRESAQRARALLDELRAAKAKARKLRARAADF